MAVVGVIILVCGLSAAVIQIFSGAISDRVGRKPLLLGAAMTSLLLYSAMAVSIAFTAPVWTIVLLQAIGQSAMVAARPATQAMVTDVSSKDQLTKAYGVLRVGMNLGWAVGPAAGGYLLLYLPYTWLFGVTAITSTVICCLIFLFLKESFGGGIERVKLKNIFSAGKNRYFLVFALLSLILFLVMGQMVSTLSVYTVEGNGFTSAQYGLLLTVNGLIVVLLQYPMAIVISRIKQHRALITGSLFYALGYLLMGWVGGFGLAIIAMVIITMGEIIFSPVSLSVVGSLAPADQRGRYMAFFGLSEGLGFSMAALLGGILLDGLSSQPLLIWGIIAFLAFSAAVGFQRWGAMHRANTAGN